MNFDLLGAAVCVIVGALVIAMVGVGVAAVRAVVQFVQWGTGRRRAR